jgi:hypothetical protein
MSTSPVRTFEEVAMGDTPALLSGVISVPLSRVLPDRFQSRELLPPDIKDRFFGGEINCYQAASLLWEASEGEGGLRRQVRDLLALGDSILSEDQIEPATGRWIDTDEGPLFLLEAGERRFWSLVLKALELKPQTELTLKVVEQENTSRVRQISENLQREDLCAVDIAKSVASLILGFQNIEPAAGQNEWAYFRQAVEVRVPHGIWPEITKIIKLDRSYLYRHLQILGLDDELLYWASVYRLDERHLREIVAAPRDIQRDLMAAAMEGSTTHEDLAHAAASPDKHAAGLRGRSASSGLHRQLAGRVRSILKLVQDPDFDQNYDRVASELTAQLSDAESMQNVADALDHLSVSLRKNIRSLRD